MTAEHFTGRVIDGRYVVEATLGQGGMGVVLRARHRYTNAQVALKMLQPGLMTNADAQERFLAEARAPSAIGHPGIVQVLDAGKTPEGELYLAMELLTGRTLRHAMTPLPPFEVTRRIVLELLDALGAAHARGIVHRDLKPENVFLAAPSGAVKLLDFGIAKVLETSTRAGASTAAGAVLGTVQYMAPEQLSDASTVDHRADLWAVGVLVYEMTTGQLPFRGNGLAELMQALARSDPDPISTYVRVSPAVEAFFTRALSRDRDRRFASAHEMAHALAAAFETSQPAAPAYRPPTGPVETIGTAPARPPTNPPPVGPGYVRPPTNPPPSDPGMMQGMPVGAAPTHPASVQTGPPIQPGLPTQPGMPPRSGSSTRVEGTNMWLWIGVVFGAVAIMIVVGLAIGSRGNDERSRDEVCTEMCERMADCALPSPDCVKQCGLNEQFYECAKTRDCNEFATCQLGFNCGRAKPSGTADCGSTLECIVECGNATTCYCENCLPPLDPSQSLALFRVLLCAARECATTLTPECMQLNCASQLRSCSGMH